ncbi:uncharacterized protein BO96DRAFT_433244 [Aspergillus niger CBS 101883]|uniref:uncharacterized protein n=1 Tax=Aspergillus lacticoffeatus (strain CBS 101883) TaxID=1450533 RepID=UPI000D7F6193|nr:uncharacterized protein BO96DRAFT_433244 [Aspergillus niger CBS 101883]PYH57797.1 hypothetical protein BO96DRAFT_433244 [Aspergillus niger CBS 101883]
MPELSGQGVAMPSIPSSLVSSVCDALATSCLALLRRIDGIFEAKYSNHERCKKTPQFDPCTGGSDGKTAAGRAEYAGIEHASHTQQVWEQEVGQQPSIHIRDERRYTTAYTHRAYHRVGMRYYTGRKNVMKTVISEDLKYPMRQDAPGERLVSVRSACQEPEDPLMKLHIAAMATPGNHLSDAVECSQSDPRLGYSGVSMAQRRPLRAISPLPPKQREGYYGFPMARIEYGGGCV